MNELKFLSSWYGPGLLLGDRMEHASVLRKSTAWSGKQAQLQLKAVSATVQIHKR